MMARIWGSADLFWISARGGETLAVEPNDKTASRNLGSTKTACNQTFTQAKIAFPDAPFQGTILW